MYMQGFKCRVTNASPVASRMVGCAKPAVWCEGDSSKCVKGPEQVRDLGRMLSSQCLTTIQMLYWNHLEGNNIEVTGYDAAGQPMSPEYNMKCGFENGILIFALFLFDIPGAQNDIFL